MKVSVSWDNEEKTIVRYDIKGSQWNWQDIYTAVGQAEGMLHSVDHPVGVMVHLPDGVDLPGGTMWRLRGLTATGHPNLAMTVFVIGNRLFWRLFDTVSASGERVRFAATLEEARALLEPLTAPAAEPTV